VYCHQHIAIYVYGSTTRCRASCGDTIASCGRCASIKDRGGAYGRQQQRRRRRRQLRCAQAHRMRCDTEPPTVLRWIGKTRRYEGHHARKADRSSRVRRCSFVPVLSWMLEVSPPWGSFPDAWAVELKLCGREQSPQRTSGSEGQKLLICGGEAGMQIRSNGDLLLLQVRSIGSLDVCTFYTCILKFSIGVEPRG